MNFFQPLFRPGFLDVFEDKSPIHIVVALRVLGMGTERRLNHGGNLIPGQNGSVRITPDDITAYDLFNGDDDFACMPA